MQKLLFALLLAVASTAAFMELRQADYIWDDKQTLGFVNAVDEPLTQEPSSVIKQEWRVQSGHTYAPMMKTVWTVLNSSARGQAPAARTLHILSFGLHLANSILVLLILSRVLSSPGAAFLGALLFALHPLQVEPVAYITATPYILGAFFGLLALWQYLKYCEVRANQSRVSGRRHVQGATLAFVCALLTTPTMAVVPLLALILSRIAPKRNALIAARAPTWPLVLWAILSVVPVAWAISAEHTHALAAQLPFWAKPLVAGDAMAFYLAKLVAPIMIGPDYGRSPAYLLGQWWGYLTWVVPVALLLIAAYGRGKLRSIYVAALTVFAAALLPYLGLVLFEGQATSTVANPYVYLAMLGPALAVGGTAALAKRSWLPPVLMLLIAGCGYLTYTNVRHWQNDTALWEHAIVVNPGSPIAHATLGDQFRRDGNWEEARRHYNEVLKVNQVNPEIYFYLGDIERQHGTPANAAALFEKTLALDPDFAEAYGRLGLAYFDQGNYEQALTQFKEAVTLAPENPGNLRYLGMLYVRKEQYAEAIPYLIKALRLAETSGNTPMQAETHALIGLAMARTGQPEAAQSHLETALRFDPKNLDAHRTLADVYYAQGLYDKARPHYESAIASAANDPVLNRNLGAVLAIAKEHDKALVYFNKALEIKPDWPEVLTALGTSYFRLKRFKEATATFKRSLALQPAQADPHYFLGDIARWQGRESEALASYYAVLKIDPEHADANYRLGNWFMKQDNPAQAIRHYKAALHKAPADDKVLMQLRKAERNQQPAPEDAASATM